jgi:hypothetical protein
MDAGKHTVEDRAAVAALPDIRQSKVAERPTQEDAYALFMRIRRNAQDRHRSFIMRAVSMWIKY